jgi:glucose-6-phosphate isomerase
MKISKNLSFKCFKKNNYNQQSYNKARKLFYDLLDENNETIKSFSTNYSYSFNKNIKHKLKNHKIFNLIGMGGSSLGMRSIYSFLNKKIKKKIFFFDNLDTQISKKSIATLNIIISKSGNTLETIVNTNLLLKSKNQNLFITENKNSFLKNLSNKLKSISIDHNDKIGGRYSVMSEVGMLPSLLIGLNIDKFKVLEKIKKNKRFIHAIIKNSLQIVNYLKIKKNNSVILNYDELSSDLFYWYQQLAAESLGKKSKGVFPIISMMPKDNHSLMQYYLDGVKKNFFTFFIVNDEKPKKIDSKYLFGKKNYLKNKKILDIKKSQLLATQNIFSKKKIPFRSLIIHNRNEEALGELFLFFMMETILIGKILGIDPYNQPAVELIKLETKKILLKS